MEIGQNGEIGLLVLRHVEMVFKSGIAHALNLNQTLEVWIVWVLGRMVNVVI